LLFSISIIFSFFPQWHWWGIDTAKSFPLWLRFALAIAFFTALLPGVSASLGSGIRSISEYDSKWKLYLVYWVICSVLLAAFVVYSERNYLLGDGFNVIGNIASGKSFSATEPLDYLWHHWIFSITSGGTAGAILSYRLSTYLAGMILFAALFFYYKKRGNTLMGLAVAICFGAFQFFFGYAESYTFSLVFSFLYILSARRDIEIQRLSLMTMIWLIMAAGFHLMSVVLIPSLIYLLFLRVKSRSVRMTIFGVLILAGIAGIIFIGKFTSLQQIYVPLWPTNYSPYHMFSIAHLKDLINIFSLNYILILLIPFLWKNISDAYKRFYLWAAIPALLFVIVVDPKIGAFRDWDLLAIASAPILGMLLTLSENNKSSGNAGNHALVLPLLIFGFLHTGGFIWQNSHRDENYLLFKEMVQEDPHYSKEYYKGYRNRPWGYLAKMEYGDLNEGIRAWGVRYQGDPEDDQNTTNLAGYLLERGDADVSVSLIRGCWKRLVAYPETIANALSLLNQVGEYELIQEIYDSLLMMGRGNAEMMYDLGVIKKKLGDIDSSFYYFDLAFKSMPSAPIDQALKFYTSAFKRRYYRMAEEGLTRIYPQLPATDQMAVGRLLDSLKLIRDRR